MPLIINTNVSSMNAQRYLGNNTTALQKTMEKLSSGYRINRAGDDAAGLQLSENLRSQIRGSQKALDNTQDGINVLNLADGAMQTMTDNLQRIRELTVQAGNDTYNDTQRSAIQGEITQLLSDVDRIAAVTQFNGVALFPTGAAAAFTLQVGANGTANVDTIDVGAALGNAQAQGLGVASWNSTTGVLGVNMAVNGTAGGNVARAFLAEVDAALLSVNTKRGNLGAFVNRLEGAVNNLSISVENLSASESRIRNVDVAAESSNLTRNQILQQASSTILAQANQSPQLALQLLKG